MQINPLDFEGVFEIRTEIFSDNRGFFFEGFQRDALRESTGFDFEVAQMNVSKSNLGTVRGIHYAQIPPGQAKYVRCVSGRVWDVIVDLRLGSPSFGSWVSIELSAEKQNAVLIPNGFGHGFQALTEDALVVYLCSTKFNPAVEHAINPVDEEIGIAWPIPISHVADKDKAAPSLRNHHPVN